MIFEEQISEWFQETARKDGEALNAFCEAFKNGDAKRRRRDSAISEPHDQHSGYSSEKRDERELLPRDTSRPVKL